MNDTYDTATFGEQLRMVCNDYISQSDDPSALEFSKWLTDNHPRIVNWALQRASTIYDNDPDETGDPQKFVIELTYGCISRTFEVVSSAH